MLVEYWGVAGGGVVADVVWGYGDAGGWWCVQFVEVECGVGGFDLVGAAPLLEGGADGCWVGGGGWVCLGGHCGGGSGESGEDECSAAGAGVDVGLACLAGVGLGVLFVSDPFGGSWWWCWELVEEVGLFLGGFSGHGGLSGCVKKLCHRGFCLVSRFSVTQVTQGSICMAVTGVCARVCVCHLLIKVVSPVSPISTLTRENPGDTRVKSCVTLCHLVSPKCLPDVRIFELQTAEHAPAAMCRARCVSTDQHPVHFQLGGERPALDRFQPFLHAPDVVGLA